MDAVWRKSSYSMTNGECVEVALLATGEIAIRDSTDPQGPVLVYPSEAWLAFVAAVKEGVFDPQVDVAGQ